MDSPDAASSPLQERSRDARAKQERANRTAEKQHAELMEFMKNILSEQSKLHKENQRLSDALTAIESKEELISALLAGEVVSATGVAKLLVDQQDKIKRLQGQASVLKGRNSAFQKKIEALGAKIASLESR